MQMYIVESWSLLFKIRSEIRIDIRWYVPQNIPKILFTDGEESSIVSDCTRE